MDQKKVITEVIQKLEQPTPPFHALVGIDGYVDLIKRVVKSRDRSNLNYFETISSFSERLAYAAGKSAQVEVVLQETKLGGNAPIMANALSQLRFDTTCVGTLGAPDIHPLFQNIPAKLLSLDRPADSTALEFNDGKIIVSDLGVFEALDWARVKTIIPVEEFIANFKKQDLIALVGLTNLHHANDLVTGLLEEVIPVAANGKQHFFFDLADPSRKTEKELRHLLELISAISAHGKVTLGLNENEALQLNRLLKGPAPGSVSLEVIGKHIFKKLDITQLLIHPMDRSLLVTEAGAIQQKGKVVKKPKIQTGAGDNLNAGFCFGEALELSPEARLVLGMANSGAYITLGHSPGEAELVEYLQRWMEGL